MAKLSISGEWNVKETFEKWAAKLGNRKQWKVGHNTYLRQAGDGLLAVRFHQTDILTLHPEGLLTIDTGGWRTVTTKQRINDLLPGSWRIVQKRRVWTLECGKESYPYHDGIVIDQSGEVEKVSGATGATPTYSTAEFAKQFSQAWAAGKVPVPNGGDCWLCLFRDPVGLTMADASQDQSHLISHLKERYFVPSLLLNACIENKQSLSIAACEDLDNWQRGLPMRSAGITAHNIQQAITKYMNKRLGLAF